MKDSRFEGGREFRPAQTETPPENLICGRNAMRELLASGKPIDKIFVQRGERDGSLGMLISLARERKIPVVEVEKKRLDTMTANARHQGVAAYLAEREYVALSDILAYAHSLGKPPFVVVCDGVEDPHNLGAIIRTAECMGAHGVVIPKRRSVGLTPVVAKASAGAIEYVRVARVPNIVSALEELKEAGLWIYAADMEGTPYYTESLTGPLALVLGGEGSGVSRLVKEHCDYVLAIPQYGIVNSLNVSNAAAVLCAEIARQRNLS